jgi:predicted anti-sigma-YlaC factor YlaD
MLTPVPRTDCSRARAEASAALDGELSELEAAQLDAHLRGCPECRAYAAEIGGLAARLRAEPLVEPALPAFVPRRRRPAARLQVAAAAVAIAAAAGSSFAVGHAVGSHEQAPSATTGETAVLDGRRPRSEVLSMLRRLHRPETGRVIAV